MRVIARKREIVKSEIREAERQGREGREGGREGHIHVLV